MRFNANSISKKINSDRTIFDYSVKDLNNNNVDLSNFKDMNPIIVVNVASL